MKMINPSLNAILLTCAIVGLTILGGCASGGIEREAGTNPAVSGGSKLTKPSTLYIGNITADTGVVKSNHPEEDAAKVSTALKTALLERLAELAPTSEYTGQTNGWLVTAKATNIDMGDPTLRMLVGAGQARVEYSVNVYDLTKSNVTPIHTFKAVAVSSSSMGDGGVIGNANDSDYVKRNTARCSRAARDEIARLFTN